MKLKHPRIASLDEVRITRDGEYGVVEFADDGIMTTNLKLGAKVNEMTDQEILDLFNESVLASKELAASYEHVVVEIPPGRPQIEYHADADQWTPRGGLLRCLISDCGPGGEATIEIDKHELSLKEFGRLLCTYAGWGMRIAFVADTHIYEEPAVEIRDPAEDDKF